MRWLLNALFVGAAIATLVVPAAAQAKKSDIQGGIEGKVKTVDVDKGTLTITTDAGRERTFTVNEDTTMVGPRGGGFHEANEWVDVPSLGATVRVLLRMVCDLLPTG